MTISHVLPQHRGGRGSDANHRVDAYPDAAAQDPADAHDTVPSEPVTVDRYTTGARINHWITASSLVLLAATGLALFHPSLYFLTNLFDELKKRRRTRPSRIARTF